MDTHYNVMTQNIHTTISEVVPPKEKRKFNGLEVSTRTRSPYDTRVYDFNCGRKITMDERKV